MQLPPTLPGRSAGASSPTESISRHIRWQLLLGLAGIALLVALLGISTYSVPTVVIPDRGGVFREGIAGTPQNLNPIWCNDDTVDRDICALIYRGLTRMDKSGKVAPDLAEGWTIDNDRIYTFRLQPDLYWQDGVRLTAADVLFTIGVLQDPDLRDIPGLPSLWRNVTVEQLDELTVRFSLGEPFAPFLDYTTIGLLPAHIYGTIPVRDIATNVVKFTPVGSGPMKIVDMAADHITLEPNSYYGGPEPYISTLDMRFYPDHASMLAAYGAGAIDGISRLLPADLNSAGARSDLQLFSTVQSGYTNVLFNLQNPNTPFFQEKEVRQALMLALDREALVRDVLYGQGMVANSLLLPEHWAFNPAVPAYGYDPAQAQALLDAAGWVDSDGDGIRDKEGLPLRFLLHVSNDMLSQTMGDRLAADWRAIGVDAVPSVVTLAGMVTDFLAPRRFEAALTSWDQVGDPDPYPQWHSSQAAGGGQNYTGWANAEADQLMEEARKSSDSNKRKELYGRFQSIFAEELPSLLLYYPVYTYGVSDRVNNVQIGSLNTPSERFANFADWYIASRRVPANQAPADLPPTPPGANP